jgi:hypothetical protein
MTNLTLLDRILIKIDSWQAKRSVEIGFLFVCFVVAPSYILFHIVRYFLGV